MIDERMQGGATSARDAAADAYVTAAYTDHRESLQRRLTAMTRDPEAAEDVLAEAFVRLAVEVRAGRTPDNAAGWLYRVSTNLVTSEARRRAVAERRRGDLPLPSASPPPDSATIAAEEGRAVHAVLSTLGPTDREALVLAANGFRGAEIAHRLGRTEGATRTLLCRARTKMRSRLLEAGVVA
jgi:RNA polymerase sigma factor (sigma-70 family)